MSFEGLLPKFKVNRPLTKNEIDHQLHQNRKLILGENDLCDDISVIKINSLYMDTANRFYKGKGWGAMISLSFVFFCIGGALFIASGSRTSNGAMLFLIMATIISSPFIGFAIFGFLKEAFTWTHYPIRFNREKQLLHVFKFDGTILTTPWECVFITVGKPSVFNARETDIRGHVLADDGITVLDTFSMGVFDTERGAYRYWEFLRRYMSLSDGPGAIIDRLTYCLPIDGQREGYKFGFWRLHVMWNCASSIFSVLFIPLTFITSWFRYLAMETSKVPQWPEEVLAQNSEVSSDDPYLRTAKNNKPLVWWWKYIWD